MTAIITDHLALGTHAAIIGNKYKAHYCRWDFIAVNISVWKVLLKMGRRIESLRLSEIEKIPAPSPLFLKIFTNILQRWVVTTLFSVRYDCAGDDGITAEIPIQYIQLCPALAFIRRTTRIKTYMFKLTCLKVSGYKTMKITIFG